MAEKVGGVNGIIFDIQRFSVHDGPGIRTNVFLKGCPIRCPWCSNPESQLASPQLMFDEKLCINCGQCVKSCEHNVFSTVDMRLNQINCKDCMACKLKPCVSACYAKALTIAGQEVTVSEVMDEVEKDRSFYDTSGGGVTFTGGEPFMQPRFLHALLKEAKSREIGTAIETCSNVPWVAIEESLDLIDVFLCDIKHTDREKLYEYTKADCALILGNIKKLANAGANITVRVPVIPGFNDTEEEINQIGIFVRDCGIRKMELLPYHALGLPKYRKLGMKYIPEKKVTPEEERMQQLEQIIVNMGLTAKTG